MKRILLTAALLGALLVPALPAAADSWIENGRYVEDSRHVHGARCGHVYWRGSWYTPDFRVFTADPFEDGYVVIRRPHFWMRPRVTVYVFRPYWHVEPWWRR